MEEKYIATDANNAIVPAKGLAEADAQVAILTGAGSSNHTCSIGSSVAANYHKFYLLGQRQNTSCALATSPLACMLFDDGHRPLQYPRIAQSLGATL